MKSETQGELTDGGVRGLYKIGVFDDIQKARNAIADAIVAGISRNDITLIAPEAQLANDVGIDDFAVHPNSDTRRGLIGGALGGVVGWFAGTVFMYMIHQRHLLGVVENEFLFASILGIVTGLVSGALSSRTISSLGALRLQRLVPTARESIRDATRSTIAGAIGGMFGAGAGMLGSYLMGIPTLGYFAGTGFFAATASAIIGGLVGAMSGRGMSGREVGKFENLTDDDQNVLVSIDCHHLQKRMTEVDELMRRDGAMMVRTT